MRNTNVSWLSGRRSLLGMAALSALLVWTASQLRNDFTPNGTRTIAPAVRSDSPGAPTSVLTNLGDGSSAHLFSGKRYRASYRPESGVTVSANRVDGHRPSLNLNLKSVSRGETSHFGGEVVGRHRSPSSATRTKNEILCTRTPKITERIVRLKDGVELFLDLEERPSGEGDLEVEYGLTLDGLRLANRQTGSGDLCFVDDKGRVSMRIGSVVAWDRDGKEARAELAYSADDSLVHFSLPGGWLDKAAYPVVIDPPIVVTSQFAVTNDDEVMSAPNVTASQNQFLIVYVDFGLGLNNPVLKARTVGAGGVVSGAIELTEAGVDNPMPLAPQRCQIASDGTDFLVVWAERAGGLFGTIIKADGSIHDPDGDGSGRFLIAQTTAQVSEELPWAAFNGEQYVVAWHDRIRKGTGIFYAQVAQDGSGVSGTTELGLRDESAPDRFIYQVTEGTNRDAVILYTEFAESPLNVRAVRVEQDQGVLDPIGVKLFNVDPAEFGYGQAIGGRADEADGWRLLSSHAQTRDDVIFQHHMASDGSFMRADELSPATAGEFTRMGTGPIGFPKEDDNSVAHVGWDVNLPGGGTGGEWLLVRNLQDGDDDGGTHLLGRRVGFDGGIIDETPFMIDDGDAANQRHAVSAAAGTPKRFLVAWLYGGGLRQGLGLSVEAALIDPAGDADASPFNKAVLDVVSLTKPVTIRQNEEVVFDWSASTGTITKQLMEFGDGKKREVAEGTRTESHVYKKAGRFVARITLNNGKYQTSDTVVINVGLGTGVEGADLVLGDPSVFTNSTNMNVAMQLRKVTLELDFAALLGKEDTLLVEGVLDPSKLPETQSGTSIAGKTARVTVWGPPLPNPVDSFDGPPPELAKEFTFILDANGHFQSPESAEMDRIDFRIDPATGAFTFQMIDADLANYTVPDKGTHKNPARDRMFELGVEVDGASYGAANVIMNYKSTAGDKGKGTYVFRGTGKESSGSVELTAFKITEGKSPAGSVHTGQITGRLIKPGGVGKDATPYNLPDSGVWRFHVGNFTSAAIDLGNPESQKQVSQSKNIIQFKATKAGTGDVQLFKIDRQNGLFTLKLNKIPAGAGGLGLPQVGPTKGAEELGVKVDIFLGFELVFEEGAVNAGGFFRVERKNARSKKWLLTFAPSKVKKPTKKKKKKQGPDPIDTILDYLF